jgi:hypothetical protein
MSARIYSVTNQSNDSGEEMPSQVVTGDEPYNTLDADSQFSGRQLRSNINPPRPAAANQEPSNRLHRW